jgi:excisionase family DNA binding protein
VKGAKQKKKPDIPTGMTLIERLEFRTKALTVAELAEILAMSKSAIYEQAEAGRIPSFKIGSARRFDPKLIADMLRKKYPQHIRDDNRNVHKL